MCIRARLYAVVALLGVSIPAATHAQSSTGSGGTSSAAPTAAEVRLLAEMHVTLGAVHDSADARAAQAKNKTPDAQAELAKQKRDAIAKVIMDKGLTDEQYQRLRYVVSTNAGQRALSDSCL